jgi:hypothetical protein
MGEFSHRTFTINRTSSILIPHCLSSKFCLRDCQAVCSLRPAGWLAAAAVLKTGTGDRLSAPPVPVETGEAQK